MSLFPLQPASQSDIYVQGNVTIDSSVAIAPGVIIQAAPESQIVIAAGACIGMGTIINASHGKIEIGAGVILGAGVLIVGQAKIGANCCIGAATTLYNASIDPMQFIPAGSVIGDLSRKTEPLPELKEISQEVETTSFNVGEEVKESPVSEANSPEKPLDTTEETQNGAKSEELENRRSPVYGQLHVNQMLLTLFPHRQKLDEDLPEDESE